MTIDQYADRLKRAGILYVDVYPFHVDETGVVRFLLLRRNDAGELPDTWQPVSGKLAAGERIRHAFVRLVKTKTGQTPSELYKLEIVNTFYDDFYDTVMFVPCAACRLESMGVELAREHHADWAWLDLDEACSRLEWPVQVQCVEAIARRIDQGGFGRVLKLEIERE